MDVTKEDDFTNPSTVDSIIKRIRGAGDVFFYCSPCTGGSAWQSYNHARAVMRGDMDTLNILQSHKLLHWRLWKSFEMVCEHCAKVGAMVFIEWPRHCA